MSRTSAAVALVMAGLLVIAPLTATAAFAADIDPTSGPTDTPTQGGSSPGASNPTNVAVSNNSANTGWHITWSAPDAVAHTYVVTVTDEGDQSVAASHTTSQTFDDVASLVDGHTYHVDVVLNDGVGQESGDASIDSTFDSTPAPVIPPITTIIPPIPPIPPTTPPTTPPSPLAPPTTATLSGYHDVTALVTWTPPADNGSDPITGYRVSYTFDGQQSSAETDVSADTRSASIPGLVTDTQYAFHVQALTADGAGAASTVSPPPASSTPVYSIPAQATLTGSEWTAIPNLPATFSRDDLTVNIFLSLAGLVKIVDVTAYSTPFHLGWIPVASDGTVRVDISAAHLPAGLHHLLLVDNNGNILGAAAFTVTSTVPAKLASTGTEDNGLAALGGLLLALGVVLVVRRPGVHARG